MIISSRITATVGMIGVRSYSDDRDSESTLTPNGVTLYKELFVLKQKLLGSVILAW